MRLCVPTSWEDAFLLDLAAVQTADARIFELFGSLPSAAIGSGREAVALKGINRDAVTGHVELARSLGFRFNYLFNAASAGGIESTPEGGEAIRRHIEWVASIGVDAVTVALPILADWVARIAPRLEIVVSTIAHVDSVAKARAWSSLGASRGTVSLMVNRDLRLLGAVRDSGALEVCLLANELCPYMCPHRVNHYELNALASQEGRTVSVDYPNLRCSLARMTDPSLILKSSVIRPEDVGFYEARGFDLIKIAGRGRDSDSLLKIVEAYVARRWDGNLIDITDMGLFEPEDGRRATVFVDNRALDGFLERVVGIECRSACGVTCGVCEEWAARAVRIEGLEEYKSALERAKDDLLERGPRPRGVLTPGEPEPTR